MLHSRSAPLVRVGDAMFLSMYDLTEGEPGYLQLEGEIDPNRTLEILTETYPSMQIDNEYIGRGTLEEFFVSLDQRIEDKAFEEGIRIRELSIEITQDLEHDLRETAHVHVPGTLLAYTLMRISRIPLYIEGALLDLDFDTKSFLFWYENSTNEYRDSSTRWEDMLSCVDRRLVRATESVNVEEILLARDMDAYRNPLPISVQFWYDPEYYEDT